MDVNAVFDCEYLTLSYELADGSSGSASVIVSMKPSRRFTATFLEIHSVTFLVI